MTMTARQITSPVKGIVNHIWERVWMAVAKLAENLTSDSPTRHMADRKDTSKPGGYALISVKDASAIIACASGKDADRIERFIEDKLAKQPAVLKMIAAKKRPYNLGD